MTHWLALLNLIYWSIVTPPKGTVIRLFLCCLLHLETITSRSTRKMIIDLACLLFMSILSSFINTITLLPEGIEALHRMRFPYLICLNVFQYLLNRFLLLSHLTFTYFLKFISNLFLFKFSLLLFL